MSLTRVSREGKTVTEMAIGSMNALSIPLDYINYRGLEKGTTLYAHVKKVSGKIAFCFSEFNPDPNSTRPESRKIQAHSKHWFRINMPGLFYTALNHSPGDKYELYHDGEGTLIYEKIDQ